MFWLIPFLKWAGNYEPTLDRLPRPPLNNRWNVYLGDDTKIAAVVDGQNWADAHHNACERFGLKPSLYVTVLKTTDFRNPPQ